MTTMARCNPFGYATDAGPKHLMGGMYGPEYAGKQTLLADGIHGPAACPDRAEYRMRMVCPFDHRGPVMDLCARHVREITARMSGCCTACVWPPQAIELNEAINRIMPGVSAALMAGDRAAAGRLQSRVEDLGRQMDELRHQGIILKTPLRLVEVS
jgi:hypothetical protein